MKHNWEEERIISNNNGGIVYESACLNCALVRKRCVDTGTGRPENTWGPYYYTISGKRVGLISCDADKVAEL